MKSLFTTVAAGVLAITTTGCATRGESNLPRQAVTVSDEVLTTKAVLNPCRREGIVPRPATEVTYEERDQRKTDGEIYYLYNGYLLYSHKSFVERWAPAAGAIAGAALANTLGSGGGRAAATIAGAFAGGAAGEILSGDAKLQRMAREVGCEAYLDSKGFAPIRNRIDINSTDRRPINTTPRGLQNEHLFIR